MAESPLAKKLQIKPGNRVLVLNAPGDFARTLGDLPADASVSSAAGGEFDLVIAFYAAKADLDAQLDKLKAAAGGKGILWIVYPKGTSKKPTDLNRDILFSHLQPEGLQGVAMVAVDQTCSALRLKKI